MKWLELTEYNEYVTWEGSNPVPRPPDRQTTIRVDTITRIRPYFVRDVQKGTIVSMTSHDFVHVKESYDEIRQALTQEVTNDDC